MNSGEQGIPLKIFQKCFLSYPHNLLKKGSFMIAFLKGALFMIIKNKVVADEKMSALMPSYFNDYYSLYLNISFSLMLSYSCCLIRLSEQGFVPLSSKCNSGGLYSSDPSLHLSIKYSLWLWSNFSLSSFSAKPKSTMTSLYLESMSRFSGLISQWMIPFECK